MALKFCLEIVLRDHGSWSTPVHIKSIGKRVESRGRLSDLMSSKRKQKVLSCFGRYLVWYCDTMTKNLVGHTNK